MARTFAGDMPKVKLGATAASGVVASLSRVATSLDASDCGATADAPQNRIPMASSAIGISHFTCAGRRARQVTGGGDGRGGGVALCGVKGETGDAPGRRP